MSNLIFNKDLSVKENELKLIHYCDGANKPRITIICEDNPKIIFGDRIEANKIYRASLKALSDVMTPAIIIGLEKTMTETVYGIYLPETEYGERVVLGEENLIFSMKTFSKHTEKNIMIVKSEVVIECLSYKDKKPKKYVAFSNNQWEYLGSKSDILANLKKPICLKLAKAMNWLTDLKEVERGEL